MLCSLGRLSTGNAEAAKTFAPQLWPSQKQSSAASDMSSLQAKIKACDMPAYEVYGAGISPEGIPSPSRRGDQGIPRFPPEDDGDPCQ